MQLVGPDGLDLGKSRRAALLRQSAHVSNYPQWRNTWGNPGFDITAQRCAFQDYQRLRAVTRPQHCRSILHTPMQDTKRVHHASSGFIYSRDMGDIRLRKKIHHFAIPPRSASAIEGSNAARATRMHYCADCMTHRCSHIAPTASHGSAGRAGGCRQHSVTTGQHDVA